MKLLCLYKQYVNSKLPANIHNILANIDTHDPPEDPRTNAYMSTIRYELPRYLQTAPPELMYNASNICYKSFKWKAKTYLIDHYTSLCTSIGCMTCHLLN